MECWTGYKLKAAEVFRAFERGGVVESRDMTVHFNHILKWSCNCHCYLPVFCWSPLDYVYFLQIKDLSVVKINNVERREKQTKLLSC